MLNLKPFERRIRLVRAWRGLAIGVTAGAVASVGWVGLDLAGRADARPLDLAVVIGSAGLLGAVVAASLKIAPSALRDSVDRRAGLDNRLTASASDVAFAEEIAREADQRLSGTKAATLYPIRVGRWHAGALASIVLTTSIFLLGSTPILLSKEERASREELKQLGQAVERVRKETFETPEAQKEMSEGERKLVEEARRLQRDLEKSRLNRQEALERANELEKQARDLAKQAAEQSNLSLSQAETAMEKMERIELEKNGLGQVDPSLLQMPQGQRDELRKQNAQKMEALKQEMAAIDKRLAEIAKRLAQKGLSDAERKALEKEREALEAKKAELQKQAEEAKKLDDALKLSDEAKQTLDKMRNHPLMEEIRKLAEEMRKSNSEASKSGKPKLTPEQRAEMKKRLEELLKQLEDDKAMKEYLEQMIEAMKNAKEGNGQCLRPGAMSFCMAGLLGLKGTPGIGGDGTFLNTGHVNRLDKPEEGKGKTFETQVSGSRRETGEETFVEIKAPTTVGNRTSVPYRSVLPSYKKKAEQAMNRKEIPKEHEKRVRAYFDSLTKG